MKEGENMELELSESVKNQVKKLSQNELEDLKEMVEDRIEELEAKDNDFDLGF
jgi:predicted DNA-binding protein